MKYSIIFSLFLMATLFSCGKFTHIPFDYTYHTTISIPHQSVPGVTEGFEQVIPTNIDSILEKNNTNANLVQSAKLSDLTLTITAPGGQTFSFLKDIQVLAVSGGTETEIAHKYNVSSNDQTLSMDIDNVELKPYLTAQTMTLKAVVTTATGTTMDMTVRFDIKVHFEANLIAAL